MKSFWCVLVLIALSAGCASLKAHDPFRNPDGTLNVRTIIVYADYGIEADCALGQTALTAEICTQGRNAIETAQAVSTNDPVLLKKSVDAILQQAAHDHPQLEPYLGWAFKLLEA